MEASLFVVLFLVCILPAFNPAADRKQKERRMAEHKMNARLLRLNI
jgi:hypothetical protein